MDEKISYLMALTYAPGLGPINQRKILKNINPAELWKFSYKELKEIFGNKDELIQYFQSDAGMELVIREKEFCEREGIDILTLDSPDYPQRLKECSDAPLILFRKGNYNFDRKLQIGVVGTRRMTSYGKKFIKQFIDDLSNQNLAIMSGLAFGCDIQAHQEAIRFEIPNVAVLAGGLNQVTPSAHKKEAEAIVKNGALVSEFSSFHAPEPMNFVVRNRIIAGLSDGVVVVESDKKGGALFTAEYANSYNREVFAVPGRLDNKFSRGCNNLIFYNKARMIRRAEDLLEYFNVRFHPKPVQKELFVELNKEEKLIYDYLKKNGRSQIDVLLNELKIPVYKLNGTLLNMELKGVVRPLSGKMFEIK